MPNQTLVSVPPKFQDLKQIRAFVVKLVEKLDVVLGYRGSSGYEVAGQAELLTTEAVQAIGEQLTQVSNVIDSLTATDGQIKASVVTTNERIDEILPGTVITDISYTAPTVSAAYSQTEVQAIADAVEAASDKVDELLGILRSIGIVT